MINVAILGFGVVGSGVGEVILICITSVVGIFGVSSALQGFLLHKMPVYQRIISAAGGLLQKFRGDALPI